MGRTLQWTRRSLNRGTAISIALLGAWFALSILMPALSRDSAGEDSLPPLMTTTASPSIGLPDSSIGKSGIPQLADLDKFIKDAEIAGVPVIIEVRGAPSQIDCEPVETDSILIPTQFSEPQGILIPIEVPLVPKVCLPTSLIPWMNSTPLRP